MFCVPNCFISGGYGVCCELWGSILSYIWDMALEHAKMEVWIIDGMVYVQ